MNRVTYFQPGYSYPTYSINQATHWPDLKSLLPPDAATEVPAWFSLLSESVSCITLHPDESAQTILAGVHQTAKNYIRYHGQSGLCIGYPFLYIRTEKSFLAVPVYLWPVSLEAQIQGAPLWFLKKRAGTPYINPWFQSPEGFRFSQSVLDHLALLPPPPVADELVDFIKVLVEEELEAPSFFRPIPTVNWLGSMAQDLLVYPCATIGVFPPSEQPLASLSFPESTLVSDHPFHVHACSELHPDQEHALSSITSFSHVLIHGDAGYGKNHLAVQAALAALDKGMPSLFIAPSLHALQRLYDELVRQGAEAATFLLRDVQEDTPVWWASLARQALKKTGTSAKQVKDRSLHLERLHTLTLNLKAAYHAVRVPVFGSLTWPDLAGKYLTLGQSASKDLLGTQLQSTGFEFTQAEYESYSALIQEAQDLFSQAPGLDHPLSRLHPHFFQQKKVEEAAYAVSHKLEAFERRISVLLNRYMIGISLYRDSLRQYLEKEYRQLQSALEELKDVLLEKNTLLGSNWIAQWRRTNWLTTLSPKARLLAEAAAEIQRLVEGIEAQASRLAAWGFTFPKIAQPTHLTELSFFIVDLEEKLRNWQASFSEYIPSEMMRLSSQHVQPEIMPTEVIEGLESDMDRLLSELHTECLPEVEVSHQLLTLQQRQKRLTELLRSVTALRSNMPAFNSFYQWQQFWLQLPTDIKKAIKVLAQLNPPNWQATFQVWFLDQVLFRTQSLNLPDNRLPISSYSTLHTLACEGRTSARQASWSAGLARGSKKHKVKHGTPLPTLWQESPEWVVSQFPIILTLPKPGLELATYAGKHLFRHVFMMDADAMTWKEAAVLSEVSRQTTAFTRHLHTPGIPENTLTFQALKNHWEIRQLYFISRWYPHHPAQLGKGNRITEWAANKPVQTRLHHLNGGYDPVIQTNLLEAEAILAFLNRELPEQLRAFPSVSIIAFTWNQKYALSHLLLQKKRSDSNFAERMEQLERTGLGVYHLSEIAGLHSGVCLVSGTFEQFPFDWLIEPKEGEAHPYLHLLTGLGYQAQHLFLSTPFEELERQAEKSLSIPASFWANYLLLLHPRHATRTETLQRRFEKQYQPAPKVYQGTELLSYIVACLLPYLENTTIKIHAQIGHLELPLFIPACPPDGKAVCLLLDGFLWQGPETNLWWEAQQLEEMASHGIHWVATWSVRWWQQPEQEARRLAAQILSLSS